MNDETRASVLWLHLVEYRTAGSDEQIIEAIHAHLTAVRLEERTACIAIAMQQSEVYRGARGGAAAGRLSADLIAESIRRRGTGATR